MNSFDDIISKQNVRLLDVFVIAPFLFYVGNKQTNRKIKIALYLLAGATLLYNGSNYLKYQKYGK